MLAFTDKDGHPKSHFKRTCKHCLELAKYKVGCTLPFRKMTQVRKWKKFQEKPSFFRFNRMKKW